MECKKCPKCGRFYPATEEYFGVNKHQSDGLQTYCKECHREYSRKHIAEKRKEEAYIQRRTMKKKLQVMQDALDDLRVAMLSLGIWSEDKNKKH